MSVKAALIGTGIFSRDVYSKLFVEQCDKVTLRHVWSRSHASAEEFRERYAVNSTAHYGDTGLSTILHDPEVQLVVVVLPVQSALKVVQDALSAGKHVIEEKPIAGTVSEGITAIKQYRGLQGQLGPSPLWMLAENYRYEAVFEAACQIAPGVLGSIIKLDLVANMAMDKTNKYYGSAWRRDTQGCPGGMIMESSVHFVSALRMLAHACGLGEAREVSAQTAHVKEDLSDPDSVVGVVRFQHGSTPASVSITLAASQLDWSLKAVGTEGSLEVSRGGWNGSKAGYTLTWKRANDADPQVKTFPFSGVQNEFSSFITLVSQHHASGPSSVLGSHEEVRASPEEGVRDLALVEALLLSGAQGGSAVDVQHVA
ncbi:hypothetical protein CEUSTIGMA_g7769.t1 [Chlamydomonas eustigma]|uniref:Gfo/Idh/MocA-like oxidoreductase N-terminal domain-containing protein n=1 Tax=Chlamydomonas eustigma TaxID=1157962 RepID=A0A250XB69_9CHLO|nr:hypothetical protein CEUSTIGMA_g7769.t1 [Chlamydomonas eustigma]|eukprot:GAX80331.1 hypothetical protein CEUSTIGMA_g7769.t1 [Chlamydomonas eustigma]